MLTKVEPTLEQSQQGVSDDVLVSNEGVEELKRNVWIKGDARLMISRTQSQKMKAQDQDHINDTKRMLSVILSMNEQSHYKQEKIKTRSKKTKLKRHIFNIVTPPNGAWTKTRVRGHTVMSDYEDSTVTYTAVSSPVGGFSQISNTREGRLTTRDARGIQSICGTLLFRPCHPPQPAAALLLPHHSNSPAKYPESDTGEDPEEDDDEDPKEDPADGGDDGDDEDESSDNERG
ncbi:hypothetical protein Tco_0627081 [Tanacetum coccineum]|uniref:Uncharacterized protein n=1 Tax=Tanacetum coccineum TaxID=301880 RepID=A0ABQ4WLG9_9ASTR